MPIIVGLACIVFVIGLLIGGGIKEQQRNDILSECAKTNNVYACQFVDVPVKANANL